MTIDTATSADEAAERFIDATLTDPALAKEFMTKFAGRDLTEAQEDIVRFAKANFYHLDKAALLRARAGFDSRSRAPESDAQNLSDDALKAASGGASSHSSPYGDLFANSRRYWLG